MGLRFRKSIKIAPGLKLNVNSKSVSVTAGTKGAHYTVNSSGRKTASVGIPGSGISYSTSTSGGSKKTGSSHNSGNGGGCLLTCLKIILAICVFALISAFAWIPGVIWLIFFRKKMEDVEKQKKYTIIIAAVSVISFLLFVYSMATGGSQPASPENPTEISSEVVTETETEITTELESEIATEPVSEAPTETQQAESEAPAADSEQTDAVSPVAEAPSDSTVEAPVSKPAEPEQTDNVAPQADNFSSIDDNASVNDTPVDDSQQTMVWVANTKSGGCYHSNPNCSGMKNPIQVTKGEAIQNNKRACSKCY